MNRPYDRHREPCPVPWCDDPHPPHADSVTPEGDPIVLHTRDVGPWSIQAAEDEHGRLDPVTIAYLDGDSPLDLGRAESVAADLREAITRLATIQAAS